MGLSGLYHRSLFPITEMKRDKEKTKLLLAVEARLLSIGIRYCHSLAEMDGDYYFNLSGLMDDIIQGDIVIVSRKKTTKSHSGVKFEVLVKGQL